MNISGEAAPASQESSVPPWHSSDLPDAPNQQDLHPADEIFHAAEHVEDQQRSQEEKQQRQQAKPQVKL